MPKLLNKGAPTAANDEFRHRLLNCGLSSVSLFYCELMGREEIRARPCAALAVDVYALYKTWCADLGVRPCRLPFFIGHLRKLHGVASKRLRYTLDGKRMGPHGVLALNERDIDLGVQIADFRRFAAKIPNGALT